MGKKKKKSEGNSFYNVKIRKKDQKTFKKLDKELSKSYDLLVDEIDSINMEFINVDKKAEKRARKKAKGDEKKFKELYKNDEERKKVRRKKLEELQQGDLFERTSEFIKDSGPIIVVFGRLIASMILLILSLDSVKVNADPGTIDKLKKLYKALTHV